MISDTFLKSASIWFSVFSGAFIGTGFKKSVK